MMTFSENKLCPSCNSILLMLYGCGWDYDRLVCSKYGCEYEVEFETTTMYEKQKCSMWNITKNVI